MAADAAAFAKWVDGLTTYKQWRIIAGESLFGPWRIRHPQHENFFDDPRNHIVAYERRF